MGGEEGVWPSGCLTSAALGGYVHSRALGVVHGGNAVALGDLTGIGTQYVKAKHTLLQWGTE